MNPIQLRPAMVVLTEGDFRPVWRAPTSLPSHLIRASSGSRYTHVFMVTSNQTAVEAWFPRVREFDLHARLADLDRMGRNWIAFDLPGITALQRYAVVQNANRYVGRLYDVLEAGLFCVSGRFMADGPKRLICSRLITSAFRESGFNLFPPEHLDRTWPLGGSRVRDMLQGEVTPAELQHSVLERVELKPEQPLKLVPRGNPFAGDPRFAQAVILDRVA